MSSGTHPNLFKPIKIGTVEIKNRIALAPMGPHRLVTEQKGFSQGAIDYYAATAMGGTGLVMTGGVIVSHEFEPAVPGHELAHSCPSVAFNPSHFIETASELTKAVHSYGSKIFIQLLSGFGRVHYPLSYGRDRQGPPLPFTPVAPSPIPYYWDPSVECRELRLEEIKHLVRAFGDAAKVARTVGFDGVEVHAVHEGYLLDQFTIAAFNKRTDEYGGDLKPRLKLAVEILNEIKQRAGNDYPVQLRFSIKSYMKGMNQGGLPGEQFEEFGRDTAEGLQAAKILEEAGYDAFDADAGTYDSWYWAHPPNYMAHGCYLPLTEQLKKVVKVPILVAGSMDIPDMAESAISGGKADMVVIGRGLIADAEWANKVFEGRTKDIRPCLRCHQGCMMSDARCKVVSCSLNPARGREREYAFSPADKRKRVVVVGGGVAGMEAARIAAERGHKVTIWEKNSELGGHLIAASVPAFKRDEARLIDWYEWQLSKLKVEISLGEKVSLDVLRDVRPDVTILATGSKAAIPDIPGMANSPRVTTASDLLLGRTKAGDSVVVIGGGLVGCETALWLAQQGKKVTVVARHWPLRGHIPRPNRMMLRDLLNYNHVKTLANTAVLQVRDDCVEVMDEHKAPSTLHADTVAICTGLQPDQELYRSLEPAASNTFLIGDAKEARNILHAVWDGYEVARTI